LKFEGIIVKRKSQPKKDENGCFVFFIYSIDVENE